MKCNICKEGEMKHEYVLYDETSHTVLSKDETEKLTEEIDKSVFEGKPKFGAHRIVHIYNCQECPNSQLEWYEPADGLAYALAMSPSYVEPLIKMGVS